jgi:FkbM family methyltransferase
MRILEKCLQLTPNFRGKLRIAKLLVNNLNNEREFVTKYGTKYKVPNLIENVSFELFINGSYEREIVNLICESIPENGNFIDVGANIGAICVEVAKLRSDIRIFAFEASPFVYKYLSHNKDQNKLTNLNVFNLAIHEKGDSEMSFYSPKDKIGKGSFAPIFTQESEMVKTVRLDNFFENIKIIPDFIKVDVEGFEFLIFESMGQFLTSNPNCSIIFEFVDWAEKLAGFKEGQAQKLLLDLNYQLITFPERNQLKTPLLIGSEMILATK